MPKKTDTSFWDSRRGIINTKIGGMVIGKAVYSYGYDMMENLVGKASYFQVLILNVTGRLPERRLADWLEAYFIGNSYPDARIWCNQIGSLGGTMRATPVAATCAGILAADSRLYGAGTLPQGVRFFKNALAKKKNGLSPSEIVRNEQRHPDAKPIIIGFARPVINGDERIAALEKVRVQLGFEIGEHLTLAYEIEEIMKKKANESMNLLGYIAPFLLDQGFGDQEIYRLVSIMVSSGVLACYAEAADQPPESFFPLQCGDIDYQGKPPRPVPEK
jgi:citrate synthase